MRLHAFGYPTTPGYFWTVKKAKEKEKIYT